MAWGKEESYKDPYDYERKTAGKLKGGRRSIASGAVFGDMDVNSPDFIIDCKRTEAKSYKFVPKDFDKVESQAKDQIPLMLINFHTLGKSYAISKEKDFLALAEEIEMLKEELEYYKNFYQEKVNGF